MSVPMMAWRSDAVADAFAGYLATGVPLVASRAGVLGPAGFSDDPGLYLFVPLLGRALGLDAATATSAFLYGLLALGGTLGVLGLLLACRTGRARVAALAAVAVVLAVAGWVGDVYVVAPAVALGVVPWFVLLWRRGSLAAVSGLLAAAGVVMGAAHVVRAHSATAVVLLIVVMLALAPRWSWRSRAALVGCLAAGMLAATLSFRAVVHGRDAYLAAQVPGYVAPEPRHPLWHSVYIGLGFTDNPFVSEYRDEVAIARAAELAPGAAFLSPAYETALRAEVVRVLLRHPLFAVQNVAAKLGVIAFYVVIFANVGLVAAARHPLPRPLALGLVSGLAFSSLFGLLVVPLLPYLTGLAAFAALFGTFALDEALSQRRASRTGTLAGAA